MVKSYYNSFFKKNKVGIATARAGNVIGGGDWSENRLIPDAIKCLKNNKKIILRNPKFNRPWQHVLEPLYGYLILAKKLFLEPKKYSGPWNFGTKQNTVTSVEEIIKKIIYYWGYGKFFSHKKNGYYEQKNLQLNIDKANKILKWYPKLTIDQSVGLTTSWYYQALNSKRTIEQITLKQIALFQSINENKKK
tara:strand:- start:6775 stop:7350 length:576 start_codon:yes stop_codon:yes gene_type:complete